ncbi:MAG: hypothetical protein V3T02_02135 [Alphaproteobacteria bacterium]
MTEIALAMAMGFFSVMVLTAMSMGVGVGKRVDVITAMLAPPATTATTGAADTLKDNDILVIYDGRRFLGRDLKPLDPGTIDRTRRIVLAVDPDLAMSRAMTARQLLGAKRLVVTTLDANWRKALQRRNHGG